MENIDEQSSDSDDNMFHYDRADRLDPYHHKTNTAFKLKSKKAKDQIQGSAGCCFA
jgi:hypothetical protein